MFPQFASDRESDTERSRYYSKTVVTQAGDAVECKGFPGGKETQTHLRRSNLDGWVDEVMPWPTPCDKMTFDRWHFEEEKRSDTISIEKIKEMTSGDEFWTPAVERKTMPMVVRRSRKHSTKKSRYRAKLRQIEGRSSIRHLVKDLLWRVERRL